MMEIFREVFFQFNINLRSYTAYKINLFVTFASTYIGAIALFFNAYFRDVTLTYYHSSFTTYAIAGAVSSALTVVTPKVIRAQVLSIMSMRGMILGDMLFELFLNVLKAIPIILLAWSFLKPDMSIIVSIPFFLLFLFDMTLLLSLSNLLFRYENPISWFHYGLWNIASGLWFPVQVLPFGLGNLAMFTPQFHLVSLIRDPLLGIAPIYSYIYTIAFTLILIPLANFMERKIYETGSILVIL